MVVYPIAAIIAALAAAFATGACASARATTAVESPALEVPPPPARLVAVAEEEPPEEAVTVVPPEAAAKRPAGGRPGQGRVTQTGKSDAKRPDQAPPTVEPPPPPAPAQPPAALQTSRPANQAETERRARELIAQARRDLQRTNYSALSADGKAQYDTARRFADQAEAALKDQNLIFALKLADNAAALAADVARR